MPSASRSTGTLGPARPAARLQHLDAEHERLRKKIVRRRRELERFEADLREIGATVAGRASPLIEEAGRLDAGIHAAFAEILGRKKLAGPARADIRSVYETLQRSGILTPRHPAQGRRPGAPEHADWPDLDQRSDDCPDSDPEDDPVESGGHRGRAAHLRDLRKTFLAVADAIHPDKVQGEEEKRARTEAMKELNRAYREGDLARILELERAWQLEGKLDTGSADEIERRCQTLERKNALLVEQLRELVRKLGSLRRTTPGAMVVDVRRLRRERDPDPIAAVLVPIEHELVILRELADFVQSFQNGEMSLARFLDGPQLPDDDEDDLDIEIDEHELDEIIDLLMQAARPPRRASRPRRKR